MAEMCFVRTGSGSGRGTKWRSRVFSSVVDMPLL